MASQMQVPIQGEDTFIEGGKDVGRAIVNRVCSFSLTGSSPERRALFFLLLGSAIIAGYESSSSALSTLLSEISVY